MLANTAYGLFSLHAYHFGCVTPSNFIKKKKLNIKTDKVLPRHYRWACSMFDLRKRSEDNYNSFYECGVVYFVFFNSREYSYQLC